MIERLISNWVYGGFLAGLLLLILAPLVVGQWPIALAITYLCLPIYMVHQYEEHDRDRFRLFFNQMIGKGHDVLSPVAVFITNVPGVWGVISLSLYLALTANIGWSLIAVYLILVNAFVHIVHAIIFRRYNPGLASAIVLFIPLGAYGGWEIQRAGGGTAAFHAIGLVTAIAIHGAILAHVRRKLVRATRPAPTVGECYTNSQ